MLFASVAAAAFFSALCAIAQAAPTAIPAARCSSDPYAYAGVYSNIPAQGIEATVTTMAAADVPSGHVAGWIGVGSTTAGPGGQAEWLQTGVNTQTGTDSELYAEITQPNLPTKYVILASNVLPGSSYQLAVVELAGKPDVWHVLLNGKSATAPIYLPGSASFQPMAMSESYDGGTPGCNGFDYRFNQLQIATHGSWKPLTDDSALTDSGYKIINRTDSGFTALSA